MTVNYMYCTRWYYTISAIIGDDALANQVYDFEYKPEFTASHVVRVADKLRYFSDSSQAVVDLQQQQHRRSLEINQFLLQEI